MKTNVTTFVTPDVTVRISNLVVTPKERKATFKLETKAAGKRKFIEENVEAYITAELYNYLVLLKDDLVKVEADNERGYNYTKTGTKSTLFQRYLAKREIEFKPNILNTMVFQDINTSDIYQLNPFRLVRYLNGTNGLSLVNVPSKKVKETVDTTTGEIKTTYSTKYGSFSSGEKVKAFIRPEKYRRLVVQTIQEIEVYQTS